MSVAIKSLLISTAIVFAFSVRVFDETCVSCGRRVCPMGISKPLRKLSVVEWMLDSTPDLHLNGVCPTSYTLYVNKLEK